MHQYFQRLRLNQGPQTTDFGLACGTRRQSNNSRRSQLIVSANHAQGQMQQLQKQPTAPKQGLPAEERSPATPVFKMPKPDVSASDRTLNVIIRVRTLHIYANSNTSSVSDATLRLLYLLFSVSLSLFSRFEIFTTCSFDVVAA